MDHDHSHAMTDIPAGGETAKDPVCGMTVALSVPSLAQDAEFQLPAQCSNAVAARIRV